MYGKINVLASNNTEPPVTQGKLGSALQAYEQSPAETLKNIIAVFAARADDDAAIQLAALLRDQAYALERRVALSRNMEADR